MANKARELRPVKLMVGGIPFGTSYEHLQRAAGMVVGDSKILEDVLNQAEGDGVAYLDREPDPWRFVVQYINTGKVSKISCLSEVAAEARALGLNELAEKCYEGNYMGWRPTSGNNPMNVGKLRRRTPESFDELSAAGNRSPMASFDDGRGVGGSPRTSWGNRSPWESPKCAESPPRSSPVPLSPLFQAVAAVGSPREHGSPLSSLTPSAKSSTVRSKLPSCDGPASPLPRTGSSPRTGPVKPSAKHAALEHAARAAVLRGPLPFGASFGGAGGVIKGGKGGGHSPLCGTRCGS